MNYFENTSLTDTSMKMYNTKLNEWISYMPTIYQSLVCIIMFPEIAMEALHTHLKVDTNTNRHIYIVAVMSFIKNKRSELIHLTQEQYSTIRVKWIDINNENEAPIIERRLENKPTDRQQAKGGHQLTFAQIVEKRDELPSGSNERLLLSMYTMIPPCRADYFATQIVRDDEVPTQKNFIRLKGTDYAECIINDFKTAKTYKQIKHVLPPELISEILASLEKNPRSYLFINTKGEPHTRNSFVLWTRRCLTRIFETDFTLVFFRHAFVTDFVANKIKPDTTDAEIKDISDKMGHSPEMFRGYKWIKSGAKGAFEVGGEDED
jgi:hypothetical protein